MFDYALLGILVILAGVIVLFAAAFLSREESRKSDGEGAKGAVVFMIGPIPIIFGNDTRLVVVAIVLAMVLIVVALLAGLRL